MHVFSLLPAWFPIYLSSWFSHIPSSLLLPCACLPTITLCHHAFLPTHAMPIWLQLPLPLPSNLSTVYSLVLPLFSSRLPVYTVHSPTALLFILCQYYCCTPHYYSPFYLLFYYLPMPSLPCSCSCVPYSIHSLHSVIHYCIISTYSPLPSSYSRSTLDMAWHGMKNLYERRKENKHGERHGVQKRH